MRFFLGFVPCCGSLSPTSDDASTSDPTPVRSDETRSLVRQVPRTRRRRKRGRLGTSAAVEWKPSLGSISEDFPSASEDVKDDTVEPERNAKRRSRSSGEASSYGVDYSPRRSTMSTIVPAFSATPFLF